MNAITQLLHPSPQMKIMLVTYAAGELARTLLAFLEPHNGTMDLSLYPGEHEPLRSPHLGKTDVIKDYRSPLRSASRDYEAIIVHDVLFRHEMPLKLLQLMYRSMENSAEIIVLHPQGQMDPFEAQGILEQAEFRAANTITDLIEGYDIFVAKKMHMWGNGL